MPTIPMFYGIIIRLYSLDNQHHNLPHIHARYAEYEASIGLADGRFWAANRRASSSAWCRPGSSCTAMNWSPIGSWRSAASNPTRSLRCEARMDWDVKSVRPLPNYCLLVELESGRRGEFDCKPYLDFGVFRELRDVHYFNQVGILFGAVTWPHEQDIAPETLVAELRLVEGG